MTTPDKRELRQFGFTIGVIVAVLFGGVLPWLFDRAFPLWPWIVAGVFLGWALILPKTLYPLYRAWIAIGHVLGWINTRIILGLIFYAMILPIGLIMRVFGMDPMRRRFDKSASSYRVQSTNQPKENLERPF
jgi:saxitoxin biosynthesis operon SxtJ-like protein